MQQITQYQNYLKPLGTLPKHITFKQYKQLRKSIELYYDRVNMPNKRNNFLKIRDRLLIDYAFATGGRIGDVVRITKSMIDFEEKVLKLYIKKTRITVIINLDNDLCYETLQYIQKYKVEGRLFKITPTGAWYVIKKFGEECEIRNLHPHMFRHGLALHLLNNSIPIPVIQYRLGHKDVKTTIQMYLKVTPEIEKKILEDVDWR